MATMASPWDEAVSDEAEAQWRDFWARICLNDDGTVNLNQVKKELSDYWLIMDGVSEVYCHIANLSKPNTAPHYIISAHEESIMEGAREGEWQGKQNLLLDLLEDGAPPVTEELLLAKLKELETQGRLEGWV